MERIIGVLSSNKTKIITIMSLIINGCDLSDIANGRATLKELRA